jgi:putative restriction endonuclease
MPDDVSLDQAVRLAAFSFLREATERLGDVLPWSMLTAGFLFEGERVCLIGQHGIWKPRILPRMPLSITTAPVSPGRKAPYDDRLDSEGLLSYHYRGTNPDHHDNVGLRMAMASRVPLIYMFGVVEGFYMPAWPVYIVGERLSEMAFRVAVDTRLVATREMPAEPADIADGRRSYVTRVTLQRLHQATFRERVLRAYRGHCAICRLRHVELLDAAHILPDGHPRGEAVIPNGLALCKLHHAAFDRQILGIRPDLIIEIRRDILLEEDGPMLKYGLQQLEGIPLAIVPRAATQKPGREFLEERYELFRSAS